MSTHAAQSAIPQSLAYSNSFYAQELDPEYGACLRNPDFIRLITHKNPVESRQVSSKPWEACGLPYVLKKTQEGMQSNTVLWSSSLEALKIRQPYVPMDDMFVKLFSDDKEELLSLAAAYWDAFKCAFPPFAQKGRYLDVVVASPDYHLICKGARSTSSDILNSLLKNMAQDILNLLDKRRVKSLSSDTKSPIKQIEDYCALGPNQQGTLSRPIFILVGVDRCCGDKTSPEVKRLLLALCKWVNNVNRGKLCLYVTTHNAKLVWNEVVEHVEKRQR
ncbi:hypothetical protein F5Y18DRAFT_392982 [Xylariaceae sp. FL1019]|nr:hypothetical protein F5Y18DRAFT_392982 [Xylariaceae sp. FL1019]